MPKDEEGKLTPKDEEEELRKNDSDDAPNDILMRACINTHQSITRYRLATLLVCVGSKALL